MTPGSIARAVARKLRPIVTATRAHPNAKSLRRSAERARVGLQTTRYGSADAYLQSLIPARGPLTPHRANNTPVAAPAELVVDQTLAPTRPVRVGVIAPRSVPFVFGGAERHWDSMVAGLQAAGFEAELVALDAPEADLEQVLDSYQRFLDLDVSAFDVVVSGKYPSWMVDHPRHLRHLNHPLRGLYERYPAHLDEPAPELRAEVARRIRDEGPTGLLRWAQKEAALGTHELPGPLAKAVISALDRDAWTRIDAHAVVSEHVANRVGYLPTNVDVAVIPPLTTLIAEPSPGSAPEPVEEHPAQGAHIVAFGRLAHPKRFDLAIAALRHVKTENGAIQLRIIGDGPDRARLESLAGPTVHFLGQCSDDELRRQLQTALALVATPVDEDFGLVAAEAMSLGCAVITTTDSGGVAEQVEDGVTGLVVAPFPRSIAGAIDRLAESPTMAARMGRTSQDLLQARSWQPLTNAVAALAHPAPQRRPRLLFLSTFPAEPVRGGGARRLREMASAFQQTDTFEATIAALTNTVAPNAVQRRILADGVQHISVGRSSKHLAADAAMAATAATSVDDIGCSVLWPLSPAWHPTLALALHDADVVILAHPYLASCLPPNLQIPVVYDAHNFEVELKSRTLAGRPGCTRLLQWAEEAEADAVDMASVISVTSLDDGERLQQHFKTSTTDAIKLNLVPNGVTQTSLDLGAEAAAPGALIRQHARRRLLGDLGLANDDPRPIALFIGSNHPPNLEAATKLWQSFATGEVILVLAGAHSEGWRERATATDEAATAGNTRFAIGRVPDASLPHLFLAASVVLNPVSDGSGTNLKLIEALAYGTPVIASAVGARGIKNPAEVLACHDHVDALTVQTVLNDPATGARSANGRRLAASRSWARAIVPLEEAIGALLDVV